MNLAQLINTHRIEADTSVPDWIIGTFKRRSISFANGLTDIDTHVFWLQSSNFSIDLRLPIQSQQLSKDKSIEQLKPNELAVLAQYQGWCCPSVWNENEQQLSWLAGTSLQLHTQWPEPGILKRVGNCMMEFCASDMYMEEWRLQNIQDGALLGLLLEQEYDPITNQQYHAGGGLIINGEYAALVLGRPVADEQFVLEHTQTLPELTQRFANDQQQIQRLFNVETSVAQGNLQDGYQVLMSTQPQRQGEPLFSMDGFEYRNDGKVIQTLTINGQPRERIFSVDVINPQFSYSHQTPAQPQALQWYAQEAAWLTRYNKVVL